MKRSLGAYRLRCFECGAGVRIGTDGLLQPHRSARSDEWCSASHEPASPDVKAGVWIDYTLHGPLGSSH